MTNCNPSLCSTCRNQFTCQKYLSYVKRTQLPNLHQSYTTQKVEQSQSTEISPTYVAMNNSEDSTEILQALSTFKDSMVETVATRYMAIENQINPIMEYIGSLKEVANGLSEKMSKLDHFIDMVEKHGVDSNADTSSSKNGENGLAVYTGAESDKVWVEKKTGIFGLGKTKWVEEDKKQT